MISPVGKHLVVAWLFTVFSYGALALSFTFSNTNGIFINDGTSPPTKAGLYPSSLTVTGLTGQVVTKAVVTLNALTHEYPSDVTLLLVGPTGQKTIVISETGGQVPLSVTNLTITLDDDATISLPVYSRLSSGTFKPTNGYLTLGHTNLPYDLPAPAPAGSSNSVCRLNVFRNTDPTGVWNLFVVDDASGSGGAISNGWALKLEIAVPLAVTRQGTNLMISWPGSAQNAVLQFSPSFTGTWNDFPTAPVLISNKWTVTNAIGSGSRWYRLRAN